MPCGSILSRRISALAPTNAPTTPTMSTTSGIQRDDFGLDRARLRNCSSKARPQRGQRVATDSAFWPQLEQMV
jgi:hypothetical protein